MALTTPNMALAEWNLSTDLFDYTALAANWGKVDVHDHTAGKGVQIPTGGIVNGAITSGKLAAGAAVANIGTGGITTTEILNGTIAKADLASDVAEPAFSTYKDILERNVMGGGGNTAGTYIMNSATTLLAPGAANNWQKSAFYFDPADYTAGSRVNKLRIRFGCAVNSVAPGITYTCGLYPIATIGGGASSQPTIATLGTVIASSTAAIVTPSANTQPTPILSSVFTAPSAAWYCLAIVLSGTEAATSTTGFQAKLQISQI